MDFSLPRHLHNLHSLSPSLGLPKESDSIEPGNEFKGGRRVAHNFQIGDGCRKTEWDDTEKLEMLAVAFGIVLHRYCGDDNLSFLFQSGGNDMKQEDNPYIKFKIVTINFAPGMHFGDILGQVKSNRSSEFDIDYLKRDEVQESLFVITTAKQHSFLLQEKNLDNIFEIQLGASENIEFMITISYAPKEYAETQIARLATHIGNILQNGLRQPVEPVDNLRMIGAIEEKQVLSEFNEIQGRDDSFYSQSGSLFDIFYKNVVARGQKVAIVQQLAEKEIQLTFEELFLAAKNIAKSLDKMQPQTTHSTNQYVAICLPQSVSAYASMLATLLLGKTVTFFHWGYPKEQIESCLATLGHPVFVTTKVKVDAIGLNYGLTFLINDLELFESMKNRNFDFNQNDETLLGENYSNENPICLFTSGSTGNPKGVLLTQTRILNRTNSCVKTINLDDTARTLCLAPLGFVAAVMDAWNLWTVGGSLHIPDEATKFHVGKLSSWIFDQGVTQFFAPAALLNVLLRENKETLKLSKIKIIFAGGERIQELDLSNYAFDCLVVYGCSEMAEVTNNLLKSGRNYYYPPTGTSIPNTSVYVLDSFCQPVPIGVTGDIYMSGVGMMAGYLNAPCPGLVPNPFVDGTQMYQVGDVGYWNEVGELCVVGRKDYQVKIHGNRLELGEVEAALQKYPGIRQAIVTTRKVNNLVQLIANCTLSDPKICPSVADVTNFLSTKLQRYSVPAEVHFVDDLKKTHSGKITRLHPVCKPLPAYEPEKIELFTQVRTMWASVLGIPEELIETDSNFFYLGGNSLDAGKFIQKIQISFPEIELPQIFAFPVLSDFVNLLLHDRVNKQEIDFEREMHLDINLDRCKNVVPIKSCAKVLLTGVTGYLGPALLQQLLESTSQTIVCIIRAPNLKEAMERLEVTMAVNHSAYIFEKYRDTRIEILPGDLIEPSFGLEASTYQNLSETVDAIYHSAADVNHMKSYEQLKLTTVAMMKNVIEFAISGKLKLIHYMSTVGVFTGINLPEGVEVFRAEEIFLPREIDPSRMFSGYSQSKWVSEKLMEKAIGCGVPAAIYRIAEIGSHSTLNVVNREDALGGFVLCCRRLGAFPNNLYKIPYVRLDSASRMIVELAESLASKGTTPEPPIFHIVEAEISLADFVMEARTLDNEPMDLLQWEREFKSKFRWDTKEDMRAYVLLNNLKKVSENTSMGSIFTNISISINSKCENTEIDTSSLCAIYYRALINQDA